MRALVEERLPLSDNLALQVYQCLGCELCRVKCPGGVATDEIFRQAKEMVAQSQFLPASLGDLRARIGETGNIAGEDRRNRLLWAQDCQEMTPGTVGGRDVEVLLFLGCVSSLFPMVYSLPRALVKVMNRAGITFTTLGQDELCCGYPLLAAGLPTDDQVERNVAQLKALGPKVLVTACPSCYHIFKEEYPDMGLEVWHASEFLARLLDSRAIPLKAFPYTVTYHDPCDLGRKGGLYEPPRRVLQAIPRLEMVEMGSNRAEAFCCGGGGNLESIDPALSALIADERLAQARAVGAEVMASACQQCERTLMMAARRARARIRVMDVAQVVLEAMEER
jgi:heterodisulfide reductase subunit D